MPRQSWGYEMQKWGYGKTKAAAASGVSYLLRLWPGTGVSNQNYTDGQDIDTEAEGASAGQGTATEGDGTLAVVSNKLALTAQSTPAWADLGVAFAKTGGGTFTKSLGLGLSNIINLSTWEEMGFGWDSVTTIGDPDNFIYAIQANATNGQLDIEGGTAVATGLSASTDYRFFLVLGGYDSNGVPWYTGETAADYLYGAALYLEISSTFYLLWRWSDDNTSALYALLASLDAVGTVYNVIVPDVDLSAVLQPTALSTFDAANGTSLDAITPEVGGGWTEQSGNWDIQGNTARSDGDSTNAIIDTLESDVIIDCALTTPANARGSIVARYSDGTHMWLGNVRNPDNDIRIMEVNGAFIERASAAFVVTDDQTYDLRMICDGQTIDFFIDGGDKISYGLAATNENETTYGLRRDAGVNTQAYNNFAIYPRTSAVYESEFDAV